MKVELDKTEFKNPINRLIAGLVEGDDVSNFSIDKDNDYVNFLFGNWNVTLHGNGKWDIA